MNEECIFCKIVEGSAPSYKIWESEDHMAFLSIFPNTEGFTVVIPKQHYDSYAFDLPDQILTDLVLATKKVAKLIDSKFEDVERTAMIFEGYGVNHIHAKLFPMHQTANTEWRKHISRVDTYFEKYEGYVSSNDSRPATEEELKKVQEKLTK